MNLFTITLIFIFLSIIPFIWKEKTNVVEACVYIHNNFIYKQRDDFSISEEENETLPVEILNKNAKNIIVNTCYRGPDSKVKPIKKHISQIFATLLKENEKIFFVGDFNINSLDYSTNLKVKDFVDHMFSKGLKKKSISTQQGIRGKQYKTRL